MSVFGCDGCVSDFAEYEAAWCRAFDFEGTEFVGFGEPGLWGDSEPLWSERSDVVVGECSREGDCESGGERVDGEGRGPVQGWAG